MEVILLLRAPGTAELEIEGVGELLHPSLESLLCLRGLARQQELPDSTVAPARHREKAFGTPLQPATSQHGLSELLALEPGPGQEAHQVEIPRAGCHQQRQGVHCSRIVDQHIAARDGLDACRGGFLVELDETEQIGEISESDGRHAEFGTTLREFLDTHQPVDKRVLGMQPQVDEGNTHLGPPDSGRHCAAAARTSGAISRSAFGLAANSI